MNHRLWSVILAMGLAGVACAQAPTQPPIVEVSTPHSPTTTLTPTSTLSPGMATLVAKWEATGNPDPYLILITMLPPVVEVPYIPYGRETLLAKLAPPSSTPRPPPSPTPDTMVFGMYPHPDLWMSYPIHDHRFRAGVFVHRRIDDCFATVMFRAPLLEDKTYPIKPAVDRASGWLDYDAFELGDLRVDRHRTTYEGFTVYRVRVPPRYFCDALYLEVRHPVQAHDCLAAVEELLSTYHEMPWLAPGGCG